MALGPCRECAASISDTAAACPACGAPVIKPPPKMTRLDTAKMWFVLITLALAGVWFIHYKINDYPAPVAAALPANPDEDAAYGALHAARSAVPAAMREPATAVLRNIIVVKSPAGVMQVCGEVNGKNGFGGMAGFSHFIVTESQTMIEDPRENGKFVDAWNKTCLKYPTVLSRDR